MSLDELKKKLLAEADTLTPFTTMEREDWTGRNEIMVDLTSVKAFVSKAVEEAWQAGNIDASLYTCSKCKKSKKVSV